MRAKPWSIPAVDDSHHFAPVPLQNTPHHALSGKRSTSSKGTPWFGLPSCQSMERAIAKVPNTADQRTERRLSSHDVQVPPHVLGTAKEESPSSKRPCGLSKRISLADIVDG